MQKEVSRKQKMRQRIAAQLPNTELYQNISKSQGNLHGEILLGSERGAIIGMDGKRFSLRVVNNQFDPDLACSAVEVASKWRYEPTLLNLEPVEVDTTIKVNFTLRR